MGILGFLATILFYIFLGLFGLLALGFLFGCFVNSIFSSDQKDDSDT